MACEKRPHPVVNTSGPGNVGRSRCRLTRMGCLGALLVPVAAAALQPLDDPSLAAVAARDGLVLELASDQVTADRIDWTVDRGVTQVGGVTISPEATAQLHTVAVTPIGADGAPATTPFSHVLTLDAGSDGVDPLLALDWQGTRTRVRLDRITHGADPTRSLGTLVLDTEPRVRLGNRGILDSSFGNASLTLDTGSGQFFYRQGASGAPELTIDNLRLALAMNAGTVGLDAGELFVAAPTATVDLNLDFRYEGAPSGDFTRTATDLPVLGWRWQGGMVDLRAWLAGGGVWYGTAADGSEDIANRSEGLHFGLRGDFASDFAWYTSEPGSPMQAVFGDWRKLAGAPYALNFPNITLDAVNAGQQPGGLCWGGTVNGPTCPGGGQYLNVAAEDGFALLIRDGNLHAYSAQVSLLDDINADGDYADTSGQGTPETQDFPWTLVYTLGDLDANLFVYPGTTGANTTGMKMDGIVKIQSNSADWNSGSHFMIGDTDINLGIGFLRSNLLFAFEDMFLTLEPEGLALRSGQARAAFNGRFGGGDITGGDLGSEIALLNVDADLEFDRFDVLFKPAPAGQSFMGYSADLHLTDLTVAEFANSGPQGSYVSIAEPGRPDTRLTFGQITGNLSLANGRVDLIPESEALPRTAQLQIGNDILFGTTVPGGAPFLVNTVTLGNDQVGSVAIPSGQWHGAFSLMRQR